MLSIFNTGTEIGADFQDLSIRVACVNPHPNCQRRSEATPPF
jgi:hypothetical protein